MMDYSVICVYTDVVVIAWQSDWARQQLGPQDQGCGPLMMTGTSRSQPGTEPEVTTGLLYVTQQALLCCLAASAQAVAVLRHESLSESNIHSVMI